MHPTTQAPRPSTPSTPHRQPPMPLTLTLRETVVKMAHAVNRDDFLALATELARDPDSRDAVCQMFAFEADRRWNEHVTHWSSEGRTDLRLAHQRRAIQTALVTPGGGS